MSINKPLADRVLIKPMDGGGECVSTGGIVLPDTIKDRPREGTVIEVGNGINDITGKLVPMEIKVGDTIAFHKNSGTEITIDEINYLIMRESEVLIILNRENAINKAMSETVGNTETVRKLNQEAVDEFFQINKKAVDEIFPIKEETDG